MALVVFTGGARCGKSKAAVELAKSRESLGSRVTFVAFGDPSAGVERTRLIENAKLLRPDTFDTLEAREDPEWISKVPEENLLLLDCLDGYLDSLVRWHDENYEATGDSLRDSGEKSIIRMFGEFLDTISNRSGDTIVVTTEVGYGLTPTYSSERFFRDLLGLANRKLVDVADSAYMVVCGRLIDLKQLDTVADWPED
ncbi:MAG: bifunctional adenosylcobinamide kinase/adenosylcobinamide-phosphate guanylyltransferase [Coriobacteriales bacterium]|jgi:adenosylcobinamide kinase/adenosylcobinamide-phosphate guanylyltransferase